MEPGEQWEGYGVEVSELGRMLRAIVNAGYIIMPDDPEETMP